MEYSLSIIVSLKLHDDPHCNQGFEPTPSRKIKSASCIREIKSRFSKIPFLPKVRILWNNLLFQTKDSLFLSESSSFLIHNLFSYFHLSGYHITPSNSVCSKSNSFNLLMPVKPPFSNFPRKMFFCYLSSGATQGT